MVVLSNTLMRCPKALFIVHGEAKPFKLGHAVRGVGAFIAQRARYVYEEPPENAIRLHLNECLLEVPDFIIEAVARHLKKCNLYPNKALFDRFVELLAEYAGVERDWVYPFSGADDALKTIFFMFARNGGKVLYVKPTFAMIRVYAENLGLESVTVDSYEDGEWWKVDPGTLVEKSRGVDLAVIVDPNNPTGGPVVKADVDLVKAISKNVRGYVVFDETYFEYAGYTVKQYVEDLPNVIVVRSLSKAFCLAGFRLGYVIASKDVIDRIASIRTPFDIPTPSLVAGIAALENRKYAEHVVNEVRRLREKLRLDLGLLGLKVYRSYTNFLLIKDRRDLDKVLQRHNVYIKRVDDSLYRITVPPQDSLCRKIVEVLAESS